MAIRTTRYTPTLRIFLKVTDKWSTYWYTKMGLGTFRNLVTKGRGLGDRSKTKWLRDKASVVRSSFMYTKYDLLGFSIGEIFEIAQKHE